MFSPPQATIMQMYNAAQRCQAQYQRRDRLASKTWMSDEFDWRDVNARRPNSRKKNIYILNRQRSENQIYLNHYSDIGIHKGTRSEIQQSIEYLHIKRNMPCISDFGVFTFNATTRIIWHEIVLKSWEWYQTDGRTNCQQEILFMKSLLF